jgi:aspartate/methionine/tyrosine aminotransferase
VAFGDIDPFSLAAVEEYERALVKSQSEGTSIRALMLCSPHNPLGMSIQDGHWMIELMREFVEGRCYPSETLVSLMKLCQKYRIHFISDEIYALSLWDNPEYPDAPKFTSVLSMELTDIIEPELVHVLWGMSKVSHGQGDAVLSHPVWQR